jgi:phosphopantothenoylcysteine decarboxylase/phosphopantothenate--cysteine ligase
MEAAVVPRAADQDVIIMAAAVADFRPTRPADHKIKKTGRPPRIELEPTHDFLVDLGEHKPVGQVLVGFAAETGDDTADVLEHGRAKLARKGCDVMVVNAVGPGTAFGQPDNAGVILDRTGGEVVVERGPKAVLAAALCDAVAVRLIGRSAPESGAR